MNIDHCIRVLTGAQKVIQHMCPMGKQQEKGKTQSQRTDRYQRSSSKFVEPESRPLSATAEAVGIFWFIVMGRGYLNNPR